MVLGSTKVIRLRSHLLSILREVKMEDSYPDSLVEEKQVPPSSGGLTVKAVITRKDGTVEDLGIISEGRVGFEASSTSS